MGISIQRRALLVLAGLLVATPFIFAMALSQGSVAVSFLDLIFSADRLDPSTVNIVLELRWPRVLVAFCVGGLLAMSGLLMQALLKNPLADPYILGVSGGAGLGGVLAAVLAPAVFSAYFMSVGAAVGALAVVLLVFGLAASGGVKTLDRLILLGVAVSSVCSALVSLLLTFSEEGLFRGLVFWLLGELNGENAVLLFVAWLVTLLICLPMARAMNVMVLGEDLARTVGVPVRHLRWGLYWVSALATGLAVAAGGMIGFVGLVVPHAFRLIMGTDHRFLIPACAVGGGLFLTLADTLARTVLAPIQLPVGVVTALIGAPVFIYLLLSPGLFGRKRVAK